MGLPGSGKTTLSKLLSKKLGSDIFNADQIRKKLNDWDFSDEGRIRQAKRMRDYCDNEIKKNKKKFIIADFICPTDQAREIFDADFIIWLDTIKKGRFEDTNKLFTPPGNFDFRITEQNAEYWSEKIYNKLMSLIK